MKKQTATTVVISLERRYVHHSPTLYALDLLLNLIVNAVKSLHSGIPVFDTVGLLYAVKIIARFYTVQYEHKKRDVKKDVYSSSWNLRATERHLPYGIAQCYLPPDTGERAPPSPQPVLDLPTQEGWKAEFTLLLGNAAARSRTRDLLVPNPTPQPLSHQATRCGCLCICVIFQISCSMFLPRIGKIGRHLTKL